jgi:hypothetical protein
MAGLPPGAFAQHDREAVVYGSTCRCGERRVCSWQWLGRAEMPERAADPATSSWFARGSLSPAKPNSTLRLSRVFGLKFIKGAFQDEQ